MRTTPARWVGFFRFHGLLTGEDGEARPALLLRDGAVWDAGRAARSAGVRPGQTAAAARVACPTAARRAFDAGRDVATLRSAFDLLAEAASVVEPDPDGRPEAYAAWRGYSAPLAEVGGLAAALRRDLPHVDLAAGLGGSRLLARAACPAEGGLGRTDPEAGAAPLAARPLRLLVEEGLLPPAAHKRLLDMGLVRCGQVANLPEPVLRARFGPEGRRLRELCLGHDPRPVRALHPPRVCAVRRAFADGLPRAVWAATAAGLARAAAAELMPEEGARHLRVQVDAVPWSRSFSAPRADPGSIARAAAELAEAAARGAVGPAGGMEVRLGDIVRRPPQPLRLWGEADRIDRGRTAAGGDRARPAADLEDLLARLPETALRRGTGTPDRHEALLAMLDPWWAER